MIELLKEYDYKPTEVGIKKILSVWSDNKKGLIELFEKHPNYIKDKYMIVLDHEYSRPADHDSVYAFFQYIVDKYPFIHCLYPEKEQEELVRKFIYVDRGAATVVTYLKTYFLNTVSKELADMFADHTPKLKIVEGQKTSRAVGKLMKFMNADKLEGYEKAFAKFSDGINPITYKQHTVLSLNPIDYLTMSFGNSWSSCQTIDKENKRKTDSDTSYHGCSSSGTLSYMLDPSTFVMYTINEKYNGTEYEKQDKVIRQLFHYSGDKMVQGRLYPQSNDSESSNSLYREIREMVQEIMSSLLGTNNDWLCERGITACEDITATRGTHYPDYIHFTTSYACLLQGSNLYTDTIRIGHDPICIECGHEHSNNEWITCCENGQYVRCAECGCHVLVEDAILVNGKYYDDHCVVICSGTGEILPKSECVCKEGTWYSKEYLEKEALRTCICGKEMEYLEMEFDMQTEQWYCPECYKKLSKEREGAA